MGASPLSPSTELRATRAHKGPPMAPVLGREGVGRDRAGGFSLHRPAPCSHWACPLPCRCPLPPLRPISGGSTGLRVVPACPDLPRSWKHPFPQRPCRPAPHGRAQPLAPLPWELGPGGAFSGAMGELALGVAPAPSLGHNKD